MLIFTYKLEKYIKTVIFPKILLIPNNYMIKGSFRRRIPYITDIDIVNNVYQSINETNIYEKIIELINRLQDDKSNIILVYISCGVDERFQILTGSDEELNNIKSLLTVPDAKDFDLILEKYANDTDKKMFYITEIIWKYYKLRWTPKDVLNNQMVLQGGIIVKFTDMIAINTTVLLQYYVKIESQPVGFDVVINYKQVEMKASYQLAADYQLKFANYSKEYYYMLFPFKYCFRDNKKIVEELEYLIEKKFGLFKQLMVRIDTYHTLFKTNNLDIATAANIIISISKDTQHLPTFTSNIIDKIREVAINNPPEIKMKLWDTLLSVLYSEINDTANGLAKNYFYKFLNLLPIDQQNKYCLFKDEDTNSIANSDSDSDI